jgi:putative membrane protein (TIGR04086 family)
MNLLDLRSVAIGALVTLVIAVPPAVVGQVMSDRDDAADSNWVLVLFGIVLLAFLIGGFTAARRSPEAPLTNGAAAAFVAFALVQGFGIVRHLVSGDDIRWVGIAFTGLLAASCGVVGGLVAGLRTRERRA